MDDPRNTDNAWLEAQVYHLHTADPQESLERRLLALTSGCTSTGWAGDGKLQCLAIINQANYCFRR